VRALGLALSLLTAPLAPEARAYEAAAPEARACEAAAPARPAPAAQVLKPVKPGECKKCRATGKLPCPEHPKAEVELETPEVLYCNAFMACAVCSGTGWTVCPTCKNPDTAAALEQRKQDLAVRKVGLKRFDDGMGREVAKAESAHFVLVWELARHKVEKKFLEGHELVHLYLGRLEALYADYLARLQITEKEFSEKITVLVWEFVPDQELASTKFCGQGGKGPIKLMGRRPSVSLNGHKSEFQNDEALHRALIHYVVHLLLSAQAPVEWIGNQKAGWLDEGIAHWFEDRHFGICDTYCFQEQNANVDFKGGRFRLNMRQMVVDEKVPPIAEVFEQNIDTLTLPQHAASFSYVDFLLSRDPPKFNELVKKVKAKVASRDALKEVFGMSPIDFEAQWKAWVLATYPTR